MSTGVPAGTLAQQPPHLLVAHADAAVRDGVADGARARRCRGSRPVRRASSPVSTGEKLESPSAPGPYGPRRVAQRRAARTRRTSRSASASRPCRPRPSGAAAHVRPRRRSGGGGRARCAGASARRTGCSPAAGTQPRTPFGRIGRSTRYQTGAQLASTTRRRTRNTRVTPSGVRGPNVRIAGAPASGAVRAVSFPRSSSTASRTFFVPTPSTAPGAQARPRARTAPLRRRRQRRD